MGDFAGAERSVNQDGVLKSQLVHEFHAFDLKLHFDLKPLQRFRFFVWDVHSVFGG